MADDAASIEREIFRLEMLHDGLDDTRVADRKKIEDQVNDLRDRLAALRPTAPIPDPPAPRRDVVAEAKDDIAAVTDIVGAKAPPRPTPDADAAESMGFFTGSATDDELSFPMAEAARERNAKAFELAQEQQARHKIRDEQDALFQPASQELQSGSEAAAKLGPDVARSKDASTRKMVNEAAKQGCVFSPRVLAGIGFGIAVVIAIVLIILKANDDDKTTAATGGATASGAGAPQGDAGPAADLTSFAGHYVLTSGLDQPFAGDAAFIVDRGAYDTVTPGLGAASFDVDNNGKITGGEYHASYRAVKPDIDCTFKFDSTNVTGAVGASGPGAIGQVVFSGKLTVSGTNCNTGYDTQIPRQIGIVGPDALMCGSNLDPALISCQIPAGGVATFKNGG